MSNTKKYLLGLFGGGVLLAKTFAVEERVLIKAVTKSKEAAISGSKNGIKLEAVAISETKGINLPTSAPKNKKIIGKNKIDFLLNFIPDEEIFKPSPNRVLKEVLVEENKNQLIEDFENWYVGEKYDWISIQNIISSDLGGQIKLDNRFRHMILFKYSNTYFDSLCNTYLTSDKYTVAECVKIKELALERGFQNDSNLLKMIEHSIKMKES